VFTKNQETLLASWQAELKREGLDGRTTSSEVANHTTELMRLASAALAHNQNVKSEAWAPVREFLERLSSARATQGFSSTETAVLVFSLKKPLFQQIREQLAAQPAALADTTWAVSELVDALGMFTIQSYQTTRESIIIRQQEELLELSTPVVKLWDGVLALPMIGTLDSARTQVVMETLLRRIVETGSEVAIIDITGVPTVDTLVAQHLLKTVTAIRLMGADCIISGIRPQIAQTIVHLGVELRGVTTKATLADALAVALDRAGLKVVKRDQK
jgi:rsbT co-antagonist protein RsbR